MQLPAPRVSVPDWRRIFVAIPEPPAFLRNDHMADEAGNLLPSRLPLREDLFHHLLPRENFNTSCTY